MPSYALTIITTNLTEEMKNTVLTLIDSGKYHMREYSAIDKTFNWREIDEKNFIKELSARHPDMEIETTSWYESYWYIGTFVQSYKNGKWIKGEVEIDYNFVWPAEIDAEVKKYLVKEFTSHFRKLDIITTEPYVSINTNDDITLSHTLVPRKEEYKDIMNREIWHPIEYGAKKQGNAIYVSIGFDMDKSYEPERVYNTENIDNIENSERVYNTENIYNTEDANSEEFIAINDDDLPFF